MTINMTGATLNPLNKAEALRDLAIASLTEDKAENVVAIDLNEKASFAHYMVVATGRSSRHNAALADKLVERLIKEGYRGINIEGKAKGEWVLIDAFDIIVHLFKPETRDLYRIEELWGRTSNLIVDKEVSG